MAAKELKALVDLGTSYTGEDLKQWLNDERMRVDREKEKVEELKRVQLPIWRSTQASGRREEASRKREEAGF